ncbi:MAG: zinc-ribbon domain-containing protein, partial [bacterium]
MIFCPACNAENPDGTKICVKCGTELPKAATSAAPVPAANRKPAALKAESEKSFGVKDMGRDIVDILWLVAILLLLIVGFAGEITHWTFKLTTTDEAKLVEAPVLAHPHPHARHHHHRANVSHPVRSASIEKMNPILETGNPDSLYAEGKKQYDDKKYHDSYET